MSHKKIKLTINVDEESDKRRCAHEDLQDDYYSESLPKNKEISHNNGQDLIKEGIKVFNSIYEKYHVCELAYYKLQLFSPPYHDNNDLRKKTVDIDNGFNYVSHMYESIKTSYDYYLHTPQDRFDLANAYYVKSIDLIKVLDELTEEINNVKEHYFLKVRSAMHTITKEFNALELKALKERVDKTLDDFLDIEQAYEFVYYQSSELMYDTINALIMSLKSIGNSSYHMEQFLGSSYAFSLSYMEWMNMFNRIHGAMEEFKDKKPEDYYVFKKNYDELLVRYIIFVIWYEEHGE